MGPDETLLGRTGRDEDVMKMWPVGAAFIAYAGVSLALYVETGDAGTGLGWPVGVAIAVLLYGVYIERRYARD